MERQWQKDKYGIDAYTLDFFDEEQKDRMLIIPGFYFPSKCETPVPLQFIIEREAIAKDINNLPRFK